MVNNPPASARDTRDMGSTPGSERSPGGGHGNPPQYSCLENPMEGGAWLSVVHRIRKSQARQSDLACTHSHTHTQSDILIFAFTFIISSRFYV